MTVLHAVDYRKKPRFAVDLNFDGGEGFDDEPLMEYVASVNIACGGHAGDERSMRMATRLALRRFVAINAHPSYQDSAGIRPRVGGRLSRGARALALTSQIETLRNIVRQEEGELVGVKPHGALYHEAARRADVAAASRGPRTRSRRASSSSPRPGSKLVEEGAALEMVVAVEGFADRAYRPDGSLVPRDEAGAVVTDPKAAVVQALSIVRERRVKTTDGSFHDLTVDTLCLHGDTPGARDIGRAVRAALLKAEVVVRPAPGLEASGTRPRPAEDAEPLNYGLDGERGRATHPRRRGGARPLAGRVRAHQGDPRPRAQPPRARNLLGPLERALLLQVVPAVPEGVPDDGTARPPGPGRERGGRGHRRRFRRRLQDGVPQPPVVHRAVSGRGDGRGRHPARRLHDGRAARRDPRPALLRRPGGAADARPRGRRRARNRRLRKLHRRADRRRDDVLPPRLQQEHPRERDGGRPRAGRTASSGRRRPAPATPCSTRARRRAATGSTGPPWPRTSSTTRRPSGGPPCRWATRSSRSSSSRPSSRSSRATRSSRSRTWAPRASRPRRSRCARAAASGCASTSRRSRCARRG